MPSDLTAEMLSGMKMPALRLSIGTGSMTDMEQVVRHIPALLAAARKVQNLLDEVARHRIDGMDVLASALWDDVMAVASDLRTAITAYEQQVKP